MAGLHTLIATKLSVLAGWVSDVRKAGSGVKIVPRVLLEGWTMADFQEVFATEPNMAQVAEFAVQNLKVGSHTVNIFSIV